MSSYRPHYTGYALNRLATQVAGAMAGRMSMTVEETAELISRPANVVTRVLRIAAGVPAFELELDTDIKGRVVGIRRSQ